MIHIPLNIKGSIGCIAGSRDEIHVRPREIFDDLSIDFLNQLSQLLLSKVDKNYPDIVSFAYWCRRANLQRHKQNRISQKINIGLGLAFHITPTNVPINCAFSFAFSLLAGNANIIRLPSKPYEQVSIVTAAIEELFQKREYDAILKSNLFITYPRDDSINSFFVDICDIKIIWGGDETVREIRKYTSKPRCREIAFADRYSICVISSSAVLRLRDDELIKLSAAYYNDIYLLDQNACSSPQLHLWLGDERDISAAKLKFWSNFQNYLDNKLKNTPINSMNKFVDLCEEIIDFDNIINVYRYGNSLYRIELDSLSLTQENQRARYGGVHEYSINTLDEIARIINTKYQTMTYFGLDKTQIEAFIRKNHLLGVDRVVPVGQALAMDLYWDGYDIISQLSRTIDII